VSKLRLHVHLQHEDNFEIACVLLLLMSQKPIGKIRKGGTWSYLSRRHICRYFS